MPLIKQPFSVPLWKPVPHHSICCMGLLFETEWLFLFVFKEVMEQGVRCFFFIFMSASAACAAGASEKEKQPQQQQKQQQQGR